MGQIFKCLMLSEAKIKIVNYNCRDILLDCFGNPTIKMLKKTIRCNGNSLSISAVL